MTRNNTTSYREKGRAVFLAALMILSVVAVPAAFAGGAAATAPGSVNEIPNTVYPGQEFNTSVAQGSQFVPGGDDAYLVEVQRDNGSIDGTSLVGTLNPTADDATDNYYEVDTSNLEPSTEYGISNTSSYQGASTSVVQTFSVINEGFSAQFDDDSVDETDSDSIIELDSDRQSTRYNLTVSVDGPDDFDADMLDDLFNVTNNPGYEVTNSDDLPLNHLGYDDGDGVTELRDDGYVTLNLSNMSDAGFDDLDGDDLLAHFDELDDGEGLPDGGEYEFEFIVTDTGATATDTISISESDEGASFASGTYQAAAGDIAEFEFELEDTDETWIQIGDADSDFVDVLYVQADDESEPVTVKVNTRLLGTSTSIDGENVYDVENADTIESAYHDADGGAMTNTPDGVTIFEDDGDTTNGNQLDEYVNDLGIADSASEQLTRPLQATSYEIQLAGTDVDNALFDADSGAGEANNQLGSAVLELENPEIGDITVHTAPGESANDETEISELVDAATARDEIAIEDRLIVQVEATGLYGGLVAGADGDAAADPN